MSSLTFTTEVVNYRGYFHAATPADYQAAVDALADKVTLRTRGRCYLTVTLAEPHRPRSTGWKSQNHHLRGHARQMCGYTGFTMSEMMQAIKEDTPDWPMEFKEFRGKRRQFYASEADISMEVASEAIEICHRIAADNDWILKESDE